MGEIPSEEYDVGEAKDDMSPNLPEPALVTSGTRCSANVDSKKEDTGLTLKPVKFVVVGGALTGGLTPGDLNGEMLSTFSEFVEKAGFCGCL